MPAPSAHAPPAPSAPSLSSDAVATPRAAALVDPFSSAGPVVARSIGHTSVVFKLALEGGARGAYKPRSRRGPRRYKGEIAAHRLARALGLSNVPRAIARSFDAGALRRAMSTSEASTLFEREVLISGGTTTGALIPWIDALEIVPLESEPWRSRWRGWLSKKGNLPDDQTRLAAQISTMIVFDYVTGNFDRWSGGNVGRDPTTGELLFIDNDGAFFEVPKADALARQLRIVRETERFSKSFVTSLERLGMVELRAALGDEAPGVPLVSERVVAGVDARRREVLAEITEDERVFE
jgi:hypothetical protein